MARRPIIEVQNLVVKYDVGQENETTALVGIDLEIYAGEYVIIFGPSGCGKSTLLNCIAGLERITSGDIKIRGASLKTLTEDELSVHRRQRVGMIFQQFNVLRNMSVLDNVALPQLLAAQSLDKRRERAFRLLKLLNLDRHAHKRPTQLSGGQQQRVAIARSLVNNPWILLADEPTGNLDSKSAGEIMELVQLLNQKSRRTIIMVTHNPDHLVYADRVVYMVDGDISGVVTQKKQGYTDELPDVANLSSLLQEEKPFEKAKIAVPKGGWTE